MTEPQTPDFGDDDGDHSAWTHRDDDEAAPHPEPSPSADAAWDALRNAMGGGGIGGRARAIVDTHRPLIEAALGSPTSEPPDPLPLDVERLARALAAVSGDPDGIVETTDGPVSALDYPEEWFETPRDLATAIAAEYARLSDAKP